MSRLSDVIHEVIEAETHGGRLDIHHAATKARRKLDDDDVEMLIIESLMKRIKATVALVRQELVSERIAQGSFPFPDLRRAYAVDTDGQYVIDTGALSRRQFQHIIALRRKQVADDTAHLRVLEAAFEFVTPYWDRHPDLTFGEVCELYRKAAA